MLIKGLAMSACAVSSCSGSHVF